MSDILNILGFDFLTETYEELEKSDGIVAISEIRQLVQNANSNNIINENEVENIARVMASFRLIILNAIREMINDLKKSGANSEKIKEQVNLFRSKIFSSVFHDPKLLAMIMQLFMECYMQFIIDTKIDIEQVPSYYSNNPEAYQKPCKYNIAVITFNKTLDQEKQELNNFTKSISDDNIVTKELKTKYSSRIRRMSLNSLSLTDNQVKIKEIYDAVCNLKPDQISKPVFQNIGDTEVVFFFILESVEDIKIDTKEEQMNNRMLAACRFIADTMVQDKLESMVSNHMLVENREETSPAA